MSVAGADDDIVGQFHGLEITPKEARYFSLKEINDSAFILLNSKYIPTSERIYLRNLISRFKSERQDLYAILSSSTAELPYISKKIRTGILKCLKEIYDDLKSEQNSHTRKYFNPDGTFIDGFKDYLIQNIPELTSLTISDCDVREKRGHIKICTKNPVNQQDIQSLIHHFPGNGEDSIEIEYLVGERKDEKFGDLMEISPTTTLLG